MFWRGYGACGLEDMYYSSPETHDLMSKMKTVTLGLIIFWVYGNTFDGCHPVVFSVSTSKHSNFSVQHSCIFIIN